MPWISTCPQTLREEERFLAPDWASDKVIYQIFPSRFASHEEVEDKIWYQAPITANAALGGSLKGIIQQLPYNSGVFEFTVSAETRA